HGSVSIRSVHEGRVVHEAPDRLAHTVLGPEVTVREPDLPTDRAFAASDAGGMHARQHVISTRHVERRVAAGERGDRSAGAEDSDDFPRRSVRGHRPARACEGIVPGFSRPRTDSTAPTETSARAAMTR